MMPSFRPGDYVLTFNWMAPSVGDVVVFKKGGKNYLKRVGKIKGHKLVLYGDNRKESIKVGHVEQSEIVGLVVFKY